MGECREWGILQSPARAADAGWYGTASVHPAATLGAWLMVQALLALAARPGVAGAAAERPGKARAEKTTVAVLWFEDRTADPEAAHWRYSIARLLTEELNRVEALRLRSAKALDYAFEQADVDAGAAIDAPKAREIGEFIEAQRVVWGSYGREDDRWHVRACVLNTATGEPSSELSARGTDWYVVRDRLVEQILDELNMTPSEQEREKMGRRGTMSAAAFEWFSKAYALQQRNGPLAEQERCIREAIAADAQFAHAHAALGAALGSQGKFEEAEIAVKRALGLAPDLAPAHSVLGHLLLHQRQWEGARRSLSEALRLDADDATSATALAQLYWMQRDYDKALEYLSQAKLLDPFDAGIRATLGLSYATRQDRGRALEALQEAARLDPQGRDLNATQMACQVYRLLGDVPRAIDGYESFLERAREGGVNPSGIAEFEETLKRLKGSLTPTFIKVSMPKFYSAEDLQETLRAKLTEAELAGVVNPLTGTEEMRQWARRLREGAESDLEKAKALFDGLTRRIDPSTEHTARTAREVFAAWNDPNESFNCQEYTKLFLVLARDVGLKAFYVHLDVDHAGRAVDHDCAIVFAEGKALLVDPAYRWFGVPHRDYVVLNDVQAIAHHHFQTTDVASCQLAAKLHRDFAWGQRRVVMSLLAAGRIEEAREALERAVELEPDHWKTHQLQGILAFEDKDSEAAGGHLRKALAANPNDADSHMLLAMVLVKQGQLAEAREHARASLRHQTAPEKAQAARQLIAHINERIGLDAGAISSP